MSSSSAVDVDEVLRRSEAFKVDNFDVTGYVSERLRSAGAGVTASQEVQRLDKSIEALSEALKGEIVSKFESLIKQVACVDETGTIIASVKDDVKEIHQITKQLTSKVREPQRRLKQLAKQLRSTRDALKLVVSVSAYLKLVKKLKIQMERVSAKADDKSKGNGVESNVDMLGELAKAAKLLKELRTCQSDEESLNRVTVVANHAVWVDETWKSVSLHAKQALRERVKAANYGDLGLVFQVYFNLGELDRVVEATLAHHTATIAQSLEAALTRNPGAKQAQGASKDGQPASALLGNFGEFLNTVLACLVDVWQTQRVLSSKFDPSTNTSFLEVCAAKKHQGGGGASTLSESEQAHALTTNLWNAFCATLSGRLGTAFYKSIGLKNELVTHYPELAQTLRTFVSLLRKETSHTNGVLSALPNYKAAGNQLLRTVEAYQNAFQAKSLNRMIEAVNILFSLSSRSLPTSSDMKRSVKCFFLEIQRFTTLDGDLIPACIANIAKAVRLMKERAEVLVATGAEAKKVGGACSNQQQRNIALCCRIQEVYTTLSPLLIKLDDNSHAKEALSNALEALMEVSSEAVAPLFRSMLEMLEESITHIQEENFTKRGDGSSDMSVYLSDLLMKISHCRTEYLAKFKIESANRAIANEMVNAMIKELAGRVLEVYAKHAALIRSLDVLGRKCLASDMKQVEAAIEKALCPLEALGKTHAAFLAFVGTLLTETEDLHGAEKTLVQVAPVDLVHHLFSRMPESVRLPHELSGLQTAKYVFWMDQHSAGEILSAAGDAINEWLGEREEGAMDTACSIALQIIKRANK